MLQVAVEFIYLRCIKRLLTINFVDAVFQFGLNWNAQFLSGNLSLIEAHKSGGAAHLNLGIVTVGLNSSSRYRFTHFEQMIGSFVFIEIQLRVTDRW